MAKKWNTSKVTNLNFAFYNAKSFNQSISNWQTTNLTSMIGLFQNAENFNQPLNSDGEKWNISKVTKLDSVFYNAKAFNQDISNWETHNITSMASIFKNAENFNYPVNTNENKWNVSKVTNLTSAFENAKSFSHKLCKWNVSNCENMCCMLLGAESFNCNISNWKVEKNKDFNKIFDHCNLCVENYDTLLINWAKQNVASDINLGACNLKHSIRSLEARQILENKNWIINDNGNFDYKPEIIDHIEDKEIVAYYSKSSIKINLQNFFKDFEENYDMNLKFSIKHKPNNAETYISDNDTLFITPNSIIGQDSIVIEAKDIENQTISQKFNILSSKPSITIVGEKYLKINEYCKKDSTIHDYHTIIDGADDLNYEIIEGNENNIFYINNLGELKIADPTELFKAVSYSDSTFFDIKIKAKYIDEESYITTRIFAESLYSIYDNIKGNFTKISKCDAPKYKIYPNPVFDYLTINSKEVIKKIIVYDLNSRIIKTFNLNYNNINLNLSDVINGTYILNIITTKSNTYERIIVK